MSKIRALQGTYFKGQNLEFILGLKGDTAKANEVKLKNNELKSLIDNLLLDYMQNWTDDATATTNNIKLKNNELQLEITKIRKNKIYANNVVIALGLIDDVIAIASLLI